MRPKENFIPGIPPGSFLLGLPTYVHTVQKDLCYLLSSAHSDEPYHLYNMCVLTGRLSGMNKLFWSLYYQIFNTQS